MHIPQNPPNADRILHRLSKCSGEEFESIVSRMQSTLPIDNKGRYLHWDDLRRHTPPEGLNHEEWWQGMRWAREKNIERTPFTDTKNQIFSYCEPVPLKRALMRIDQKAGGFLGMASASFDARDGQKYLVRSLVEEPFHSSLIEGAATTREIAKKMILESRKPETQHERMVYNNYRGMQFVRQHKDDRLTVPFILELHKIITENTLDDENDAGRIRTRDDILVVDDSSNEILHTPPPSDMLLKRMETLCDFANRGIEDEDYHHPLARAIILHFMLSYDHPFADGNGRTARALFYWSVLRSGYWVLEYISISSVIAEAKVKYGQAFLHVESDQADLTYFLIHQADTIWKALERLDVYVQKKREEMNSFETMISKSEFNDRQIKILHDIAKGHLKEIGIASHQKMFNVSYLTARSDLEDLVAQGLLSKKKRGQESVYFVPKDFQEKLKKL